MFFLLRRGRTAISANVGSLRDRLAFHCGQQLGAARRLGQVELRVERIELEDIVVIARAWRGTRTHVSVCAPEVLAGYRAFREFPLRDTVRGGWNVPGDPVQHVIRAATDGDVHIVKNDRVGYCAFRRIGELEAR